MNRPRCLFLLLFCLLPVPAFSQGLSVPELKQLHNAGAHPESVDYFRSVIYANAAVAGGFWNEFTGNDTFGGTIQPTLGSARFDANGYPLTLAPGNKLGLIPWSLHGSYSNRPPAWPELRGAALGKWVVTWKGRADIQPAGGNGQGVFIPGESSGAATGLLTDGRRTFVYSTLDALPLKFVLEEMDASSPLTDLKVWLPDPADPMNLTLERPALPMAERLFHPDFIKRIRDDAPWGYLRMMDLTSTNNSPVRDWADRRPAGHVFAHGVLHPRDAMDGKSPDFTLTNQDTGIPYEHAIALCNQTGRHLWINVPHLASPDFITKLARLIQFGSDGTEPFTSPQANPLWAPLDPSLNVIVEYSNEIWNSIFAQGQWALRPPAGFTRESFIASQTSRAWQLMEAVLGSPRVIRMGAVQSGNTGYTRDLLTAWRDTPALLKPECMGVTTYFGQNIQHWAQEQSFFTGRLPDDPYWQSAAFASHQNLTFDHWEALLLAGTSHPVTQAGFDSTEATGGIPDGTVALAREFGLPMVVYEGGPSLYTTDAGLDPQVSPENFIPGQEAITTFIESLNRHHRMKPLLRAHLELARSKGIWAHTPFVQRQL